MIASAQHVNDSRAQKRPSVSAIVITFNPDLATFETILAAICPQVDWVVIVDNGSKQAVMDGLEQVAARHRCVLKALGENLGIATAQNRGIETVREHVRGEAIDSHFVLFLDHDSIPAGNMVQCLLDADFRIRERGERVGGVGPVTVDKRTGTAARFMREGRFWLNREKCPSDVPELSVDFLISSGTLTRLDVMNDVGGMNDGLFIDHVDTEWCLRALARGYRFYAARDALLTHSLGDEVVEVWSGRRREVFVHSPIRDYYASRNTLLLLCHVPMSFAWRAFLSVRLVAQIMFFGFFVAPRRKRLKLMGKGLLDGVSGRSGKMN
ncbi:glycosyltransferase family 2 protein [Paraburkholderia fungorum]|uniref:glycosyltransferase family 2 protein n=1 Tax=Paraburkholderia fungorum TaxID=134537 RepID=UPI003877D710